MDWTLIIELLMGFLSECGQSKEQRRQAIRQPGRVWLGATRALRQTGIRGRDLWSQRAEIMQAHAAASEAELDAFVDLCDDRQALGAE